MARLRYWLMAALLATACGTAGDETAAPAVTEALPVWVDAQGFWILDHFTVDGERHEVEVGVNTASEAWVEIGEAVQARLGCNTTGREITRWGKDTVTISGGHSTEIDCGWQDERLMEVELLMQSMMANEPIQIEVDGDTMLWKTGETQLVFRSIPASPETTAAPTTTQEASARVQGFWILDHFTVAGEQHPVEVGVNTAKQPWLEIGEAIGGNAGCNTFGASIEWTASGFVALEVAREMQGCWLEGADLMAAENTLVESLQQVKNVEVLSFDDPMVWRVGTNEFIFYRIDGPPVPPTTLPPREIGKLDCSPGYVIEESIEDSARDTEQILRDEVPEVVRTEQDLEFAPPAPDGWFWLGYDADDNLIAFIARGDIEPPRYQLWTCSDG